MATGAKVSFNHYQGGKFGTCGTMSQNQVKEMEISQEMHLKMSKKIAQLTKVIYALNTKNDENETLVASTREHHEEQTNQIFQELKLKIENIQRQVSADKDHNSQIQELKSRLENYEKYKQDAVSEFEEYKQVKDTKTMELESHQTKKVIEMSHEVLTLKKDFQNRMAHLEDLERKLVSDKEASLQAEREKHREEMEELSKRLHNTNEFTQEQQRVQDEFKSQIATLSEACEKLTNDKNKLVEEYELKINKLQTFHENELQVLRNAQTADTDSEVQRIRDELQKSMKDFSHEKADMTKRIEGLLGELSAREEEVENLSSNVRRLEDNLNDKSSSLEKEMLQAKANAAQRLKELEVMKIELLEMTESNEKKSKELLKHSAELTELQETKLKNDSLIADLNGKLSSAQDRIKLLESSKRALEGQSSEQSKQLVSEIESLTKQLATVSSEMEKNESEYREELKKMSESYAQKEKQLQAESAGMLEKSMQQHEKDKEKLKADHERQLTRAKEEISAQLDAEISRLMMEKQETEDKSEVNRGMLLSRLAEAEKEVDALTAKLKDEREACNAAKSKLKNATSQAEKFQKQVEGNKVDLENAKKECKNLQGKLHDLEKELESRVNAKDAEAKMQHDQLLQDLNKKWTEKIQKECMKITEQITRQKNEEYEKLTREKDAEIKSLQTATKKEIQELKKQLAAAKSYADNVDEERKKEIESEKAEAEAQMKLLREEMLEAANDYAKKIESMQSLYMRQLNDLTNKNEREKKALEDGLKSLHCEEMESLTTTYEATLESTRREAEDTLQLAMEREKQNLENALASLRAELVQRHAMETEQNAKVHHQQIAAARMELERAIDLGKQKDVEHQIQVNEMEETVRFRMLTIRSQEEDIKKLQISLGDMTKEFEAKVKEVLLVRSEANKAVKLCEEHLSAMHRDEVQQLSDEYNSEKERMLSEFMEAQELLKDKISTLNLMLEEAEERYKNRESRDEDLELIKELQLAVQEREMMLRKMTDEKRKFQMELVNRETNFNKVFNANPQVGILNPLAAGKPRPKKGERTLNKYAGSNSSLNSVGSGSGRLQPLPNSPIHDEQFNHTRPLPPTKKFVK